MSRLRTLDELYEKAKKGDPAAQFEFAKTLEAKGFREKNELSLARARIWYALAAKQGYPNAQSSLATLSTRYDPDEPPFVLEERKIHPIEEILIALKYPTTSDGVDGVCHGIAMKGLEAALLGQQDIFNERLTRINMFYEQHFSSMTEDKDAHHIFKSDKNYWDTLAFLDSVAIHADPAGFNEITGARLRQQDFAPLLALASSKMMESKDHAGFKKIMPPIIGAYNSHELDCYCALLKEKAEKHNHNIALNLKANGHSISLFYNAKENHWTLNDANELPPKIIKSNYLAEALRLCLCSNLLFATDPLCMVTTVHSTGAELEFAESFVETLQKTDEFKEIHVLTPEKLEYKDAKGRTLWEIAYKESNLLELINKIRAELPTFNFDTVLLAGQTLINIAIIEKTIDVLKKLIEAGINVNVKDTSGLGVIHHAIQANNLEALKILIAAHVDINAETLYGPPINTAITTNNIEALKILLEAKVALTPKNPTDSSPVILCLIENNTDAFKLLIAAGAKVHNEKFAIEFALSEKNMEILKILIKEHAPINLTNILQENRINDLKMLIEAGMPTAALFRDYRDFSTTRMASRPPDEQKDKSEAMTKLSTIVDILNSKLSTYIVAPTGIQTLQHLSVIIKNAYDEIYSAANKSSVDDAIEKCILKITLLSIKPMDTRFFSMDKLNILLSQTLDDLKSQGMAPAPHPVLTSSSALFSASAGRAALSPVAADPKAIEEKKDTPGIPDITDPSNIQSPALSKLLSEKKLDSSQISPPSPTVKGRTKGR